MNALQQILMHMVAKPMPSIGFTWFGTVTLAVYSWFEESLPLIQWAAAAGAIMCSVLSLVVIVLTIEDRIHKIQNRPK